MIYRTEINTGLLQNEEDLMVVPVGISNHHVHLTAEHIEILFGKGAELHPIKPLSQPGQFACEETVQVVGHKGSLAHVRVLGPARKESQVELSQTDARTMGLTALLRDSGNLEGTQGAVLIGPEGYVILEKGVIIPKTHLHLSTAEGAARGIADKDLVDIYLEGHGKSGCLFNILTRVGNAYALDLHVDTDEANAFALDQDAKALIIKIKKPESI